MIDLMHNISSISSQYMTSFMATQGVISIEIYFINYNDRVTQEAMALRRIRDIVN